MEDFDVTVEAPVKTMRDHAVEHLARATKRMAKHQKIYDRAFRGIHSDYIWNGLTPEYQKELEGVERRYWAAFFELHKCQAFAREMGVPNVW